MAENDKMRNCKEGFKRIRMKVMQSERLDKAREEIRQKMRELKKAGKAAAASAAANPRLMRLKAAMKRKQDEEEAAKHTGPTDEEKLFNDRMYYDFMKEQKEARKRVEMEEKEKQARLGPRTILRAAQLGDSTTIEKLLDAGEGTKIASDHLFTPLHAACARGKIETVKFLVQDRKADVEKRDKYGCTPVVRAAASGHMNVVKWLTETPLVRANMKMRSYWGASALHFASEYGHVRMCEYLLLRQNMDVLEQTDSLDTPYDVCAKFVTGEGKETNEKELREMFFPHVEMAKNMMVATLGSALDGVSAEEAAQAHKISIAEKILQAHREWEDDQLSDIREYENNVKMLFEMTREGRRVALDDVFVDPNMCDIGTDIRDEKHGRSLLHIAAVDGDCDLAEVILDSTYLSPIDTDGKGRTALHLAALYGHMNMVELMLDNASPPGPEGKEKLTSAKDDDGKTPSDLLCQRWKPTFREGMRKPPDSIVRAEKIRIRKGLEYVLDPEREGRELEEAKVLATYENQVNLSKTYQSTGMKAPQWIRDNAKEINSKLGGMRARQRKIQSRNKRKLEFEKRKKEREALAKRELQALSRSSKKMRDKLKDRMAAIEYTQAIKITFAETRLSELEPGLALANARIAKEERFLQLCHVRVASLAVRNVSSGVRRLQQQADVWIREIADEKKRETEGRDDWLRLDDDAKKEVVDRAAIEQLELRLDACRYRYENQLKMMEIAAIGLQAGMMPDRVILENMKRIVETGVRVNWKLTRRKGQNFMKAGKTVTEEVSEKERKKIAAEAIEIKSILSRDERKLKHDRQMIMNKQHGWDLRNAILLYEYAEDHIGRRSTVRKRDTHRSYSSKIEAAEKLLQSKENELLALKKHLSDEYEYRDEDVQRKWLAVQIPFTPKSWSKKIGLCANYLARSVCYRWDLRACDAMILNLEEEVEEAEKLVETMKSEIDDLRDEELAQHADLKRENEESLRMMRYDIGEEILTATVEDAIELPFVSDSDSGDGSAWDSDEDRIDGGSEEEGESNSSRQEGGGGSESEESDGGDA